MTPKQGRVVLMVLDGVAIGECPHQADYGDSGSDTLGNIAREVGGLDLPHFQLLGLSCCRPLAGMRCFSPTAAHGVAIPRSPGKDSTPGHWEICELLLDVPFPTYPLGFPPEVVSLFARLTGRPVIGNTAGSGIAIIDRLAAGHVESGARIVYTSADIVFQVAAHEDQVPLDELYWACEIGRVQVMVGEHAVSRVIARPLSGSRGAFERTPHRKNFSLEPPGPTLLDRLAAAGIGSIGIGKVDDLFAGRNINSTHPASNSEAYNLIADTLDRMESGLLFANVVEFDQTWGHGSDVEGFYMGLQELDRTKSLRDQDLMITTADHGNDPTTPSTDHSREAVPVLVVGEQVTPENLGIRSSMADIGATIADYFHAVPTAGESFLGGVATWATH